MPPKKKLKAADERKVLEAFLSDSIPRQRGILKHKLRHTRCKSSKGPNYATRTTMILSPVPEPLTRRNYLCPPTSADVKRHLSLAVSARTVRRLAGPRRAVVRRYRNAARERRRVMDLKLAAENGGKCLWPDDDLVPKPPRTPHIRFL